MINELCLQDAREFALGLSTRLGANSLMNVTNELHKVIRGSGFGPMLVLVDRMES